MTHPEGGSRAPLDQALAWAASPDAKIMLASDQFSHLQTLVAEVDRLRRRAGDVPRSQELVDAMNDGRWQDATYLLLDKVDALYRGSPSEAWQPIEQLKARIEKAGWPNQPGGLDVIYVNDVLDMLDELPACTADTRKERGSKASRRRTSGAEAHAMTPDSPRTNDEETNFTRVDGQ